MSERQKVELEYLLKTSPKILYTMISTPSGLSEWFADNVNVRDNTMKFFWEGSEETAKVLSKVKDQFIRFQWDYDDGQDGSSYPTEYADERGHEDDQYETDYAEPNPINGASKYKQGRDDEFEPSPEFQNSWKGEDDESQFDSSNTGSENAFHQSSTDLSNNQAELSQEELDFLGMDDQQKPASQYDTISELD